MTTSGTSNTEDRSGSTEPAASGPDRAPLLAVLGATGTGKTELAVALAERVGGEVINFDASCVYRGLDIGTAKPDDTQRSKVPHHLVDVCEPMEGFSAARFVKLAEPLIESLRARGRRPLFVGGNGLYLRCLLQGMASSPPADGALRERLAQREARRPGSLHRILHRLDPITAERTPAANQVRLIRALEYRILTGEPLGAQQVNWEAEPIHSCKKIGLRLPRAERETRLRARIDSMIASGLVAEVRSLLDAGHPREAPAFRALGYRDVIAHLDEGLPLDDVKERMLIATRQYAKRQDTWFAREKDVLWFDVGAAASELPPLLDRVMIALQDPAPPA